MDRSATLPKLKTPYFDCLPHQIRALRKALGWKRGDLGTFVGATIEEGSKCRSVLNWECGHYRPTHFFRIKLVQLAELAQREYLAELARAESVPVSAAERGSNPSKDRVEPPQTERTD